MLYTLITGGKAQGASEGGIRVPGILRWPNHIPANTTVATPTSLLDTLPTMLHLAGLPSLSKLLPHLPQRVCIMLSFLVPCEMGCVIVPSWGYVGPPKNPLENNYTLHYKAA